MTSVADLLKTTQDLSEKDFVQAHPATALVVEPFADTDGTPLTRKLSRSALLGASILDPPLSSGPSGAVEPPAPPDLDDDSEETMVIRRAPPTRMEPKVRKESWRRSPEGFLHPEARVVWLVPDAHNQIPGILAAGRGQLNDLRFNNETVSKTHALFHWRGNHWLLEDFDSANGTFLNGAQLPPFERRRLNERSAIRLGLSIHATLFGAPALFRFCGLLRTIRGEGS